MKRWIEAPRPALGDLIAGLSVALLLIPQSLAYAQLAEMPLITGLFASAIPLIVRAPFASSPYLQTGPVALTSLLTLAALQSAGFQSDNPEYAKLGAILALLVGIFRFLLGALRMGWVVYLISGPVMQGFTSAAAIIIICSQIPKVLGTTNSVPDGSILGEAAWSITNVNEWQGTALIISVLTVVMMVGGRKLHRLFPGVALAVIAGIAFSLTASDPGAVAGEPIGIPEGLPSLSLDLPWDQTGGLIVGGAVIALVGFAEPASIARVFASEEGTRWDSNKELISTGVANLASALSGSFPVGGSFSRSSVNRVAGAKTLWSGGITGVIVVVFLPFASILNPLPLSVLGAIIVGAVYTLIKPQALIRQLRRSWIDAVLTWATFIATLVLAPDVQWAILLGVVLSGVLHLIKPLDLQLQPASSPAANSVEQASESPDSPAEDLRASITPVGLVWLGSYRTFDRQLRAIAAANPSTSLVVNFSADSAIEPAIEDSIATLSDELSNNGRSVDYANVD